MKNKIAERSETSSSSCIPQAMRKLMILLQHKLAVKGLRESTLQALPFWIAASIAGLIAVGYAKALFILESIARQIYSFGPFYCFIVAPLGFLGSWALVRFMAPEAAGSGIPQLMAATELRPECDELVLTRLLGVRTTFVKILSSGLCMLAGGAIGREGPTLQISGAVFNFVAKRMPREWAPLSRQSMLIAGGAAGLAAAFNTPLGGIVYVIEELSTVHLSFFRTAVLQVVIVAGLLAQLIIGPYLYLGYPEVAQLTLWQLPSVLIVGVVGGLAGALFGKLLYFVVERKDRFRNLWAQAAIALGCGVLFATLYTLSGNTALGSGKEVMVKLLFKDSHADLTSIVARMSGSLLSYSTGAAGGIFAPALATGACLGSYIAQFMNPANAQLLVLLGMIAFLTGVTRTPFTSFVLVLEMTDRHSAIFPMMIASFSAYAMTKMVDHESFYEIMKKRYLSKFADERKKAGVP